MREEVTKRIIADEGKVFVRKADGFVMGPRICLGRNDTAENYEEREMTEEEEKAKYRDPFEARREEMRRMHEERRAEILARIKAEREGVTNA